MKLKNENEIITNPSTHHELYVFERKFVEPLHGAYSMREKKNRLRVGFNLRAIVFEKIDKN